MIERLNKQTYYFAHTLENISFDVNLWQETYMKKEIFGAMHACGTFTILGRPVVPDVVMT